MQRVIIDIPDNKIDFFLKLVKQLGFNKVHKLSKGQKEFVDDLNNSLKEVEQHRQGKRNLQKARDFLDEI